MAISGNDFGETMRSTAEEVLTRVHGGAVRLGLGEALDAGPGAAVSRFAVLEGPSGLGASVIVKQATQYEGRGHDPNMPGGPADALLSDWAGLEFLTRVAPVPSPAPRFYGGDRSTGVIVMEDLGPSDHLDALLLGEDPRAAEAAVSELGATLGRMHALTIGRRGEYERVRAPLVPSGVGGDFYRYDWLAPTFLRMAELLGVEVGAGVAEELAALRASLLDPGPFLAYVHADACPDNCVRTGEGVRVFDHEHGRFGHALIDGVYGRMCFPSCWCAGQMPERVVESFERAYRTELARGCPEAEDDEVFYRAVIKACMYWLIRFDRWYPLSGLLERDEVWDTATLRQRLLLRFGIAARTMRETEHLEAIGSIVAAMDAKLRALWSPDTEAMPPYPALR